MFEIIIGDSNRGAPTPSGFSVIDYSISKLSTDRTDFITLCRRAFLFTKNTNYIRDFFRISFTIHNCFWSNLVKLRLSFNKLTCLPRKFILNKENAIFVKNLKEFFLPPDGILREYTPYKIKYQQYIYSLGKYIFF